MLPKCRPVCMGKVKQAIASDAVADGLLGSVRTIGRHAPRAYSPRCAKPRRAGLATRLHSAMSAGFADRVGVAAATAASGMLVPHQTGGVPRAATREAGKGRSPRPTRLVLRRLRVSPTVSAWLPPRPSRAGSFRIILAACFALPRGGRGGAGRRDPPAYRLDVCGLLRPRRRGGRHGRVGQGRSSSDRRRAPRRHVGAGRGGPSRPARAVPQRLPVLRTAPAWRPTGPRLRGA